MSGRHYIALGYCDEVDLENFLMYDIDNTFSAQIEDWIAAAERQVNKYLGYTTASGILSEQIVDEKVEGVVDSDLNLVIFPRKTPIISVTSLDLVKGSSSITLSLTDGNGNNRYDIPTSGDRLYYPDDELSVTGGSIINSFADLRNRNFFTKFSYIAGYTEAPADIRLATVNLVSDFIMRHTNKEGLASITQGKVSKRWNSRDGESDFYKDAIKLLQPYRIAHRWVI